VLHDIDLVQPLNVFIANYNKHLNTLKYLNAVWINRTDVEFTHGFEKNRERELQKKIQKIRNEQKIQDTNNTCGYWGY